MAILEIKKIPDPVLYRVSESVHNFDRRLRSLVRDMFDTMYEVNGVGLAAVQIGLLKRLFVIDLGEHGYERGTYVNPFIIEKSDQLQTDNEGCLSVPGLFAPLARPNWVKIGFQDLSGRERTIEAEGFFARAVLHEMDHIDGKIYVDQLEPSLKKSLKKDIEKIKSKNSYPQS